MIFYKRNAHKYLVGNPEGERSLGRHKSRRQVNLKEIGREACTAFMWLKI
jgi:hypothetical protein